MPVSRKTRGVARGNANVRPQRRQQLNDGDGEERARSDVKRGQRETEAAYRQSALKLEAAIAAGEARVLALQRKIQAHRATILPPQSTRPVGIAHLGQDGALKPLPVQPCRSQETDSRFAELSIRYPDISVYFFKAISQNSLAPTDILQLSTEYKSEREDMLASRIRSTLPHGALEEEELEAFSCEFGGPTHLLRCFLRYCAILLHFTPAAMRHQLSIGLFAYQDRFLGHPMIYTWESVRSFHFIFHKLRLLENIADGAGWSRVDRNLEALHLVRR